MRSVHLSTLLFLVVVLFLTLTKATRVSDSERVSVEIESDNWDDDGEIDEEKECGTVVLIVGGSRGDAQPLFALAFYLQRTDCDVVFIAPVENRGLVESMGVPFIALKSMKEIAQNIDLLPTNKHVPNFVQAPAPGSGKKLRRLLESGRVSAMVASSSEWATVASASEWLSVTGQEPIPAFIALLQPMWESVARAHVLYDPRELRDKFDFNFPSEDVRRTHQSMWKLSFEDMHDDITTMRREVFGLTRPLTLRDYTDTLNNTHRFARTLYTYDEFIIHEGREKVPSHIVVVGQPAIPFSPHNPYFGRGLGDASLLETFLNSHQQRPIFIVSA